MICPRPMPISSPLMPTLARPETLALPADARGVAIDAKHRRAFVTTQLEGEFTRSVQVITLDTPALMSNISLIAEVVQARGMAVVPSSGEVVVAVSRGGDADGLMIRNPDARRGGVIGAIQNVHHSDSFSEPIDVAVLEDGGLALAFVRHVVGVTVEAHPRFAAIQQHATRIISPKIFCASCFLETSN